MGAAVERGVEGDVPVGERADVELGRRKGLVEFVVELVPGRVGMGAEAWVRRMWHWPSEGAKMEPAQ